jgi:hypothetical protein
MNQKWILSLLKLLSGVFLIVGTSVAADKPLSTPRGAQTGQFRVADWYGGPVETAKGILSGWPEFFVADPSVIYAETTRYDPQRVDLLQRANINWVGVVWSAGFSNESERVQHDLLRSFIAECHRRGIHVAAYLSIANLFAEDMFAHQPESRNWVLEKDGQPVPYGAADYKRVGRVTRYMADLRKTGWQEEVLRRALAAVTAGVDGLNFDNNDPGLYGPGGPELMGQFKARLLAEGRKRNPHLIVSSNYHSGSYLLARYENGVNTEDGIEPGIFRSEARRETTFEESHSDVNGLPVKEGRLVLNAGLLRTLNAVSEGWRPVVVNYSRQRVGTPFTNVLSAAHQKLALAECQAFQGANENFQDGKTYRDLFFHEKNAAENWDAVRLYNAFFEEHESLYTSPVSLARVAVVINAQSEQKDRSFLNALAARNLIYDVVYEQDATATKLGAYRLVIAAPSVTPRPGWRRYEAIAPAEFDSASPIKVTAPDSVVVNMHGQAKTGRIVIDLLNYGDAPVWGIEVVVKGKFAKAQLLSPDAGVGVGEVQLRSGDDFTQTRIPKLEIYNLLVLD